MRKKDEKYVVLEKSVGQTPLQAVEQFRRARPELRGVPMAYAGRLDPMASGKLLVLIGEECKKQKEYFGLDKEYEFEVLLGVASDSGDVLGIVEPHENKAPELTREKIQTAVKKYPGDIQLPYPRFSSKTVDGKPLHTWTLEGRLDEIEIPTSSTYIHTLKFLGEYTIPADELKDKVFEKIDSLPTVTEESKALGRDFRRNEVKESWNTLFEKNPHEKYTVLSLHCTATSGTYMRALSEALARELGTSGLALSIHRTKIGTYQPLFGRFGYWKRKY